MTTQREAMKIALEALENVLDTQSNPARPHLTIHDFGKARRCLTSLRQAIEQAEKDRLEKIASKVHTAGYSCYPPTAPAQPLTISEIEKIIAQWDYDIHGDRARYIARMVEQAHGIGEHE